MKSRIKITSIDDQPFHSVDYLNVAGKRQVVFQTLPFLRAETPHLPPPLQLLVFTADLQGREKPAAPDGERRLLGEIVAEDISILSQLGDLPPRDRIGVCLCGDFFSRPGLDRRGGSGDCRHVWLAFRDAARWVCGVAGNHDIFGPGPSEPDFNAFKAEAGVYFLEEDAVELDGMNIGGVSGIVGNPRRPFRRQEEDYSRAIKNILGNNPDLFLLHDGPDYPESGFKGWPDVRNILETGPPVFTVRGHTHWPRPLVELSNGTQVLNVDSLVVLLFAKGA